MTPFPDNPHGSDDIADAVTVIWTMARTKGAASSAIYHQALHAALVIDEGRAALRRTATERGNLSRRAGADTPAAVGDLASIINDTGSALDAVDGAVRTLATLRRKALREPGVARPPGLDRQTARLVRQARAMRGSLDPARWAAFGRLSGTPTAAATMLAHDPLFSRGILVDGEVLMPLSELPPIFDALQAALVSMFAESTTQSSRAARVLRRLRATSRARLC